MTDTDLIARMEAGHARALAEAETYEVRAESARRRASEIELAIRTAREFAESATDVPVSGKVASLPVRTAGGASDQNNGGEPASTGKQPSIRELAVALLARTPGKVWAAQEIADTLLAEGYSYPNDRKRLRETVSTVLKQHIESGLEPKLEKPEPARFMVPQVDAFGVQTSLVEAETAASGETLTTVSED